MFFIHSNITYITCRATDPISSRDPNFAHLTYLSCTKTSKPLNLFQQHGDDGLAGTGVTLGQLMVLICSILSHLCAENPDLATTILVNQRLSHLAMRMNTHTYESHLAILDPDRKWCQTDSRVVSVDVERCLVRLLHRVTVCVLVGGGGEGLGLAKKVLCACVGRLGLLQSEHLNFRILDIIDVSTRF